MFIDETWANTSMARPHGRTSRGERLRVGVPHGHWTTTTVVAALTLRGTIAPVVLPGRSTARRSRPMSGGFSSPSPGPATSSSLHGLLTMLPSGTGRTACWPFTDDLSSHKGPNVRALVEAAGARPLFLPPDSPDLDP